MNNKSLHFLTSSLPQQLQAELDHAWRVRLAVDDSEQHIAVAPIGLAELRRVEHVEKLRPKLQADRLLEVEIPVRREVEVGDAGLANVRQQAARRAERERLRLRKDRRIEPAVQRAFVRWKRGALSIVVRARPAAEGIRIVRRGQRQRSARLQGGDAGDSPS